MKHAHVTQEWCAPGTSPTIDNPNFQDLDLTEHFPKSVAPALSGRPYSYFQTDISPGIREQFRAENMHSFLQIPVMLEGKSWGALTFVDSGEKRREWSWAETDGLETLAGLIGVAVIRARYVKELADANTIVQNSPTILYLPPGIGLTNEDWNKRSRTEVSFNSGLVWQVDTDNIVRFTAGRGVQLPNLLDLGGLLISTPFGYGGGIPTLKPTIVMNYGLDWDHDIPAWDAKLRVRLFHETTDDIVSNTGGSLLPLGLIGGPTNIGDSVATGGEISLTGTYSDDWRWGLSYTPEVISDDIAPKFTVLGELVDYEHTTPVHVVNANLGWSKGAREIDGYLRYQSRFDSIQGLSAFIPAGVLVRIPDYVSVDARVAYRINKHVTVAVSGQNLLDSPQRQTSAPAVERIVLFTVSAAL